MLLFTIERNLLLPNITDDLEKEARQAPKAPDFVHLPSLSAPTMREVPPIFIIPGIFNKKMVQNLAAKLLYPVYCASFPITWLPFKKMAANLAQVSRTFQVIMKIINKNNFFQS